MAELAGYQFGVYAGAKGYISKNNASRELIRAIRAVSDGYHYLCPELTTAMVEVFLGSLRENEYAPAPMLTPREREVLRLLTQGAGSKEITFKLGLSPKTVDAHRHNIMSKVSVDSLAGLVKYALLEGLACHGTSRDASWRNSNNLRCR